MLATWHELLDAGRAQDGDEHLAGTAKPAARVMSLVTATSHGLAVGEQVAVSTERGAIVVPVEIAELPDQVVWLPSNARDCAVRATLGAAHGSVVTLTNPSAPPVVGSVDESRCSQQRARTCPASATSRSG